MAEDVEFEGEALDLIAHRAEGGMRNALTSLEQVIAFGEGKVTLEKCRTPCSDRVDTSDMAEIVRFVGTRDIAVVLHLDGGLRRDAAPTWRSSPATLPNTCATCTCLTLSGADTVLEISERNPP